MDEGLERRIAMRGEDFGAIRACLVALGFGGLFWAGLFVMLT